MKKPNIEKIEKEEELKFNKKVKRKKVKMRVDGAGAKRLGQIIKDSQ